jgi:hypothetical protein
MQLSNSHNHRALIEQSYTKNAIYFNNGKIDQGTEEIVTRYAYMSNPKWKIELTPIQLLSVQEDLVYEIGEYRSGGVGHYFILCTPLSINVYSTIVSSKAAKIFSAHGIQSGRLHR